MIAPTEGYIGQGRSSDGDATLWVLAGTGALIGIWHLFLKPKVERPTEVAPVAPREAPVEFATLAEVTNRFGQVRELFKMGYIDPPETYRQLEGLLAAIDSLKAAEKADPATAQELVSRIGAFIEQVREYENTVAASV